MKQTEKSWAEQERDLERSDAQKQLAVTRRKEIEKQLKGPCDILYSTDLMTPNELRELFACEKLEKE